MKLIRDLIQKKTNWQGCILTIGNFDGVHLGHAEILTTLKNKAHARNLPSVVMIFEPQPLEFFSPHSAPARLTSLREKYHLIKQFGIDYLYVVRFEQRFADLDPEQWIQSYLINQLQVKTLFIGDDFKFGRERKGDFALLQSKKNHFEIETLPTVCSQNKRISSTWIRSCLAQGQLQEAKSLLGRDYSIQGNVIYGNQLARQFGFPTANINMDRKNPPLQGVYFVKVFHLETAQFYFGVANIGFRPTINGKKAVLETHLFDFDQMIYGEHLEVIFLEKLRKEQKFNSLDELKQAIAQDICKAKQIKAELTKITFN